MQTLPSVQLCCGCLVCIDRCPHDALFARQDPEGFLQPNRDTSRCTSCGLCELTCPVNTSPVVHDAITPVFFAALAIDDDVRIASSSGGVFSVLAEAILDDGGVVCGAVLDHDLVVRHKVARTREEVTAMRGSKYVQSDTTGAYRAVLESLSEDESVLFTGTPCQVAGLRRIAEGRFLAGKLVTVDVVCHGVPSQRVFNLYIHCLREEHGSDPVRVSFRNKDEGWQRYSVKTEFASGAEYRKVHQQDRFMQAFLQDSCLRWSCYQCPFSRIPRVGDITLADFWGVREWPAQIEKGISIVSVNTAKGQELWDLLGGLEAQVVAPERAIAHNPRIYLGRTFPGRHRKEFLCDIEEMAPEAFFQKYGKRDRSWRRRARRGYQKILSFIARMNASRHWRQ